MPSALTRPRRSQGSRPSPRERAAVLTIARRRSFRAAALELGRSSTALSSAIAKLEASLGVRLFNRTTRSVSLSDAGRAFVEQAGPALAGRLLGVLENWTPELPGLCLYYPSRRNASAALRAFVALARELAAERPHGRAATPASA